jgi:hypothetical protein
MSESTEGFVRAVVSEVPALKKFRLLRTNGGAFGGLRAPKEHSRSTVDSEDWCLYRPSRMRRRGGNAILWIKSPQLCH